MKPFDPGAYKARLAEARNRYEAAAAFREADRVPVAISAGGSYYAHHLAGANIRTYFTDLDTMVRAQVAGLRWRMEALGDDTRRLGLRLDLGPVQEGLVFDTPIEFPDDTSPRIVPILKTRDDVLRLRVPDFEDHPRIRWFIERGEKFTRTAAEMGYKDLAPSRPRLTIHPPLSAACAIMDPTRVYEMMALEPDLAGVLLDKCLETFIRLIEFWDRRYGTKTTHLGLADDNTCFISNEMFRRFVLPRNLALYERFGSEHRSLHTDGPSDQHFVTYADDIRLDMMDIGGWSSIDAAVRGMKGKVLIHGAMNNRDLYSGLTDEAKRKMRRQMRVAGPGGGYEFAIGGETYVGVEPGTLVEFVAYAKEIGRYPIRLAEDE